MKIFFMLSALLGARAFAAPDPAWMRSALPPGFEAAAFDENFFIPLPAPVLMNVQPSAAGQTVVLAPLLDRHLTKTDAFSGAGGKTYVAATLDLQADGYLAVTPPGSAPKFFPIERGMSGSWSDGVHQYRVSLSVNIFRARLSNVLVIRNTTTGKVVWEKRIIEMFRLTYNAGEPVNFGGRPYRLFYSARPDVTLCFIYDEFSDGVHDYKTYMVPLDQIRGASPVSYKMYGGDVVKVQASPDLSSVQITR